jgi:CRISPR-associated protein Csd1
MIPLWLLLKKTANSHSQDNAASPLMAGSLFRAILADQPYPEALFQNLMLRIFSEQDEYNEKGTRISEKIGSVRAAGLKAYLLKNHSNRWEGKITMNVNDNCRDMAYVLGRLFSVLENVQQNANPGINATIKDRYFNSACATPASVFPILLKLANSHLAKIDTPFQIAFNKKIGHLLSLIVMPDEGSPIPNRLSLEEQGAFVLGYYQETQDRYTKKGEKEND